jgi:hypothetical protein
MMRSESSLAMKRLAAMKRPETEPYAMAPLKSASRYLPYAKSNKTKPTKTSTAARIISPPT